MANDYIKLWVKDYRALLEPFSEAERGRILWAMMDYKESGSEPSFLGNERFVWAAIKAKIDASNEAYERQAAANRANGARGGRPRKNKENQENPKNRMGFETPEELDDSDEQQETSTGPPDGKPESYWVWAGCDKMLTPYMASEFRELREAGVEDALVVGRAERSDAPSGKVPLGLCQAFALTKRQHKKSQRWKHGKKYISHTKKTGLTGKRRVEIASLALITAWIA